MQHRLSDASAPLLVIIAGNSRVSGTRLDAFWSGYPILRDSFPDRILVVGASDYQDQLWTTSLNASQGGARVDLVAPGVNVTTLDRFGVMQSSASGTSYAAPHVTGVAGLLWSFDPSLTRDDVRALIVAGAVQGGRSAAGTPVLNAYESLKLAAARVGAPLCGNRVWADYYKPESSAVFAQRGSQVERLFAYAASTASISVKHGGRRVVTEYWSPDGLVFDYQGTASPHWLLNSQASAIDSLDGGAWSSTYARNHGGDSLAYTGYGQVDSAGLHFDVTIWDTVTWNSWIAVQNATLSDTLTTLGSGAWSPARRSIYLPINHPHGAAIHEVDLNAPSFNQASYIFFIDSVNVAWMGVTEDGNEIFAAEQRNSGCSVVYRTLTGVETYRVNAGSCTELAAATASPIVSVPGLPSVGAPVKPKSRQSWPRRQYP